MKHKYLFTFWRVSILALCSCDYDSISPAAYFSNNSSHEIVVYWAEKTPAPFTFENKVYPDTTLPDSYYYYDYDIAKDSASCYNPISNIISMGGDANVGDWDPNPIDYLFSDISRLSVFVLHADTVRKYSWDEIRDNYNIIVRYDLSKDDVKSFVGYTIPFPPTEAMRDMKMWPPYEEVRKRYFHNDVN